MDDSGEGDPPDNKQEGNDDWDADNSDLKFEDFTLDDLMEAGTDIKDDYEPDFSYLKPMNKPLMKPTPMTLISRKLWRARRPKAKEPLNRPVKKVSFIYNTDIKPCTSIDECMDSVQELQRRAMDENGQDDIPYNFIVGGDQRVYEGRGWKYKPDKANKFPELYDSRLDIAFVGDWREVELPLAVFDKALDVVYTGVRKKYIMDTFDLVGISDRHN